jgi:hypothetical protein
MKQKICLVILALLIILVSCSEKGEQQSSEHSKQTNALCGDGVCDQAEQQNTNLCPDDCAESADQKQQGATETSVTSSSASAMRTSSEQYDLFGTMLAFQSSQGFAGNKAWEEQATDDGWASFWEEHGESFLSTMQTSFSRNTDRIKQTQFSSNRDVVGAFSWNVIEPTDGADYDWSLADATVEAAQEAGVDYVATIQPYSNWGSPDDVNPDTCSGIDFVYFDYKSGYPTDEAAYKDFVRAAVERYDGDGVDDMPALTTPITMWEIGNEVEGPCSGSLSDGETYLKLLKMSYEVIKEEQPDAVVVNAGALEIVGSTGAEMDDTIAFWEEFFAAGGAQYIDIFNLHYNRERFEPETSMEIWERHLSFFRDLLDENGAQDKKLWVTEFGTGTIQDIQGDTVKLDDRTKTDYTLEDQAAWYLRYTVMGMSYGVERIFIDLSGADGSGLGSSAYFSHEGSRLFLVTLLALAHAVEDYDHVEVLENGQYLFTTGGKRVYVLWDGELPSEISGTVTVIDVLGEKSEKDASEISFSERSPVIITLFS